MCTSNTLLFVVGCERMAATFPETVAVSTPELEEAVRFMCLCSPLGAICTPGLDANDVVKIQELCIKSWSYELHLKVELAVLPSIPQIPMIYSCILTTFCTLTTLQDVTITERSPFVVST